MCRCAISLSVNLPMGSLEQYSYDPVGNRLTDATASYSYDAANRLLSKTGVSYTWDANGNLTGKTDATGTITYRYDGDNRLVQVTRGGSTLGLFTYDPFGRRVSKTTATGTVYYVYDGEDILAEVDAAGNLLTYYVHGPGIDEPLAMIKGTKVYYYHADALGTITHLTKSSGAIAQSYDYDSFGNITSQSGPLTQPYTYTAREWDPETGLYYYRARYYDPQVGRFITEDPIRLAGGINFYTYVEDNPVNWVDPKGLESLKACGTRVYLRERGYLGGKDDKYKHCVVACRIMQECGTFAAVAGIFYKEYQDYSTGTGTPEWADVTAGFKGLRCPRSQNCYIHCLYEGFGGPPMECCPGVR